MISLGCSINLSSVRRRRPKHSLAAWCGLGFGCTDRLSTTRGIQGLLAIDAYSNAQKPYELKRHIDQQMLWTLLPVMVSILNNRQQMHLDANALADHVADPLEHILQDGLGIFQTRHCLQAFEPKVPSDCEDLEQEPPSGFNWIDKPQADT